MTRNAHTADGVRTTWIAAESNDLTSSFNRAAAEQTVNEMSRDEKHAMKQKFKIWIKHKIPSADEVKIAKYISSLDADVSILARRGFMAMSENDRCACTAIVLD